MGVDFELGPIVRVDVYRQDLVVHREAVGGRGVADPGGSTRGEIFQFSPESRRRLMFVVANTDVDFLTLITLTYPAVFPKDGLIVRAHRRTFLEWCRRRWPGMQYLWFLEWQQRQAPHIHLMLDQARKDEDIDAVALYWYHVVGSGDPKHLQAGTSTEKVRKHKGLRNYAVKEAAKMYQKTVPAEYRNVGRLWGCSRGVTPQRKGTVAIDEKSLRAVLATWRYLPPRDSRIWSVLFGAADTFRAALGDELDNVLEP